MSLGTPAVISRALLDFVSRIAFVTASGYGSISDRHAALAGLLRDVEQ